MNKGKVMKKEVDFENFPDLCKKQMKGRWLAGSKEEYTKEIKLQFDYLGCSHFSTKNSNFDPLAGSNQNICISFTFLSA